MARIQYIDEPNLIVPLAASFNQRGILGYTQAVTNADDQLKINSIYEPIKNSASGNATLYLSKRPGVTTSAATYGVSSQTIYLHDTTSGGGHMVVAVSSGAVIAAISNSSSVVSTTTFRPAFLDKTSINATSEFLILQLRSVNDHQVFSAQTGTTAFTEIFVTSIPGATGKIEWLDGYGFQATTDGLIINSELNTVSTWKAASFIKRRIMQDDHMGLARLGSQLLSFGSASMEVYRNVGTAFGSPLVSEPSMTQRYGLKNPNVADMRHYYAQVGMWIYWVGQNPRGIYAYNGQSVEKVSTPAIDKIITEKQHFYMSSIGFSGQLALSIGLDLTAGTVHRALLFFPEWKEWFIWQSNVAVFQTTPRQINFCMGIGATEFGNRVLRMAETDELHTDMGTSYPWTHQFQLPRTNGHRRMDMFGLLGDTATTTLNVNVQFSDNDYSTFSNARTIDMTSADKRITRCGGYQSRAVKLTYTGEEKLRLEAALARVS